MSASTLIELRGITKRYPGVVANDGVDLRVGAGEVHAVIGENGAGKSTLMRILYGMTRPDEGRLLVEGQDTVFTSPSDAIAAGIGMVHQHFKLADNLTVLENVILGAEPTRGWGRLDLPEARRQLTEIAERYGMQVRPDAMVADLSVGQRQRVEIVKVLFRGARILILDEPTAVLVPQETRELLTNMRELVREGLTIVFISHKLDEVLSVADRITVMRAGRTVETLEPSATSARELAQLMVGSELPTPAPREVPVGTATALQVQGVSTEATETRIALQDVDLTVHRSEIVGVAGVEGNGQTELIDVLLGLTPPTSGTVHLTGEDVTTATTAARRADGLAYIPQDRHREGLLLEAPLWENRLLGHQMFAPMVRSQLVDRGRVRASTREVVAGSDVRTPSIDVMASALSGGNQQKLIVGRELEDAPRLLIAAHPTRGVDVGAQAAIWDRLVAARAEGLGVLLISADLEELIGLADRIVVMLRGRISDPLDPAELTAEKLGAAMTGVGAV